MPLDVRSPEKAGRRPGLGGVVLATIVCIGAALRLPGVFSDLWLDEVWSLTNAGSLASWTDVFLRLKIDNNHHLNTLYLMGIGPDAASAVYRMPAFLAGLLMIVIAWKLAADDGKEAAFVAALLFATSYLMVEYAGEARGYSAALCLSMTAWLCLQRYVQTRRRGFLLGFWACVVVGAMAHPTVLFFVAGSFFWADVRLSKTGRLRQATRSLILIFAVPGIALGLFYVVALRSVLIAGGPPSTPAGAAASALSLLAGGPSGGAATMVVGALVGALVVWSLQHARSRGDDRWVLYAVTGVIAPAVLLASSRPDVLFPRYFIVPVGFLLLSLSTWLATLLHDGGLARVAATGLIVAHVSGGIGQTVTAASAGKGQYGKLVQAMATASPAAIVTVASADEYSGHDFRNRMLVNFYLDRAGLRPRLQYLDEDAYPPRGTDWLIRESFATREAEERFRDAFGNSFGLNGDFVSRGLSGEKLHLYRRLPAAP